MLVQIGGGGGGTSAKFEPEACKLANWRSSLCKLGQLSWLKRKALFSGAMTDDGHRSLALATICNFPPLSAADYYLQHSLSLSPSASTSHGSLITPASKPASKPPALSLTSCKWQTSGSNQSAAHSLSLSLRRLAGAQAGLAAEWRRPTRVNSRDSRPPLPLLASFAL